jgi:hypothetical protein
MRRRSVTIVAVVFRLCVGSRDGYYAVDLKG